MDIVTGAVADASTPADPVALPTVEGLFDRHGRALVSYLARRVGLATAEDLVSETFIVVLSQLDQFDPDRGSERAWLFGIATNLFRRYARSTAREATGWSRHALQPVAHLDVGEDTAARVDAHRQVRQLASAIAELNPIDQDVLLLVVWGGLSPSETAQALDIPAGTARSRLHRIRTHLRTRAHQIETPQRPEGDPDE